MHSLKSTVLILAFVILAGTAYAAAPAHVPTVIDWSKGAAQDTRASCGAFEFRNMENRHTYQLYVRGMQSGTCSFHETGLIFHMPPNHGTTTPGYTTLYSFARFGADVLVAWTPGY